MATGPWGSAREVFGKARARAEAATGPYRARGRHRSTGPANQTGDIQQQDVAGQAEAADRGAADRDAVLQDEFGFTELESAHAAVLQLLLACRDVDAATAPTSRALKAELLDSFAADVSEALDQAGSPLRLPADLSSEDVSCEAVAQAARAVGQSFDRRSRAMLVLVDLQMFRPWPTGHPWNARVRHRTLVEIAGFMSGLRDDDLAAVAAELDTTLRALRRRQVRWGRVAVVGALGLGIGAATAGLAAPLIGASIGAAAGLSGAAATSAGLAALGGGSLAAGGFGVAGGTAFVVGVGAVAGAGMAAGGARAVAWANPSAIALDALRAEVVTRLVVLGEEHDEEKAKRVVQALQARLDTVTSGIAALGARIEELTEQKAALQTESTEQREELDGLRTQLVAERDRALLAEAALEVALDRIPITDLDDDLGPNQENELEG